MDYKQTRLEISALNALDLDITPFSHLIERLSFLLDRVPIGARSVNIGQTLWRARVSDKKLHRIEEFGCPPADKVKDFQRCNSPHDPMFYCAETALTAILEVRPSVGDQVYLSRWNCESKFFTNGVPPDKHGGVDDRRIDSIATFMETRFRQPIHETFSSQYKMTAAITDRLLCREFSVSVDGDLASCDGVALSRGPIGVSYPSCATPGHGYETCFALRPDKVYQLLLFAGVQQLEVCKIDKQHIRLKFCDHSDYPNGGSTQWIGANELSRRIGNKDKFITGTLKNGLWLVQEEFQSA